MRVEGHAWGSFRGSFRGSFGGSGGGSGGGATLRSGRRVRGAAGGLGGLLFNFF